MTFSKMGKKCKLRTLSIYIFLLKTKITKTSENKGGLNKPNGNKKGKIQQH